MKKLVTPIALFAAALLAAPLMAQDAPKQIQPVPTAEKQPAEKKADKEADKKKLAVGDAAPAIKVEAWVKGEPVKEFQKGKVYVVEFWATWCGPCVAAFPHLSEMQEKYKDKVTFIGTNIWERPYNGETLEKVKSFVAEQGDKMKYTVAFDGKAAEMDAAYMKAAGRNGIPSAFIVDGEGKIAWMGHPMSMEKVLEEVVAGKYDIKAAAEKEKAAKDAENKVATIRTKLQKAARAEKWDEVVAGMDEMAKVDPENKGQYLYQKYMILMSKKNDFAAAYGMKDALLGEKQISENGQMLNQIAWGIVDPNGDVAKKDRNLDFALAIATKANDVTKSENAAILDTLARVYWEKGEKGKAIEWQEKAVKASEKDAEANDQMKEEIKATLEEYKKANAKSGA